MIPYIRDMCPQILPYRLGPEFPARLKDFVENFLTGGFEYFSSEFACLDSYLKEAGNSPPEKELRRTDKAKYLLELVSFQVYDNLNRDAFNRTRHTLIVMPDCLCLHNPECQRVETRYGTVCRRCDPGCQAYHIGELARRYRAKVIFSKRKLAEQLQRYQRRMENLGVVGIACINMLAEGMRTAAEVNIPARGVLLNFSGCDHWNDQPCASEFSVQWLESILKEKDGQTNTSIDHR